MDRTGIIVISLCAVLLLVWFVDQQKYYSHLPPPPAATNAPVAAPTATGGAGPVSSAPAASAVLAFDTNLPEQTLTLTNRHARYTFTSRGGGLKLVELLDYPETVSARWKKQVTTNGVATLNTRAAVPVLAVLGDSNLVGDGAFALARTDDGARAEKLLPDGLRLVKEFHLSSNYLVNASVRLENTSDKPLALGAQEWVVGTATPMDADDRTMIHGAMWFDGSSAQDRPASWFSGATMGCFRGTPRTEFRAGATNVVWVAAHNQFFTLLAMPRQPAEQMVARPVALPPFPDVEAITNAPPPLGVQTALVYPAQTLATNQVLERNLVFFAGPKEYRTLAKVGLQFQNRADAVMGFSSFWGFFAKGLLLAMNWLHDVTRLGYGSVIVLITIIIRVVFWPLTAASTRSMKRMAALAPELNALKQKYKDDMQKLMQKQQELYRKNKVNPVSGCLPMLVQMPIFIGFFTMIRSAIELRGAHFLWVADLSKPDTLFMIPGVDFPFNPLPLLMGGAMLWQSHLTPPSPGMDPMQAKIMRYLPLIFLVFLYSYSSGLTLYWTVNNVLTIVQTKLTKMNQPAAASAPALTPPQKKKK